MTLDVHFFRRYPTWSGHSRAAIDSFVEAGKVKTPTLSQTGLAARPTVTPRWRERGPVPVGPCLHARGRARDHGAIATNDHLPEEVEARRRLACVNAAESARRSSTSCTASAASVRLQWPRLDRCLRDLHTVNQHLAVSPVWWEKTGQYYWARLGMP
jgi:hypothetical protein